MLQTPAHITTGSATLAGGSVDVTFTGSATFTDNTTFFCTAVDTHAPEQMYVVKDTGSQITINGTGLTDTVDYICVGT
jgi:hypothetical protein